MLKSLHISLECITLAKEINKIKHKTMKKLKRNYIQINTKIYKAIKKQDLKSLEILLPKFYKLQNTLIDKGVNLNTIYNNI